MKVNLKQFSAGAAFGILLVWAAEVLVEDARGQAAMIHSCREHWVAWYLDAPFAVAAIIGAILILRKEVGDSLVNEATQEARGVLGRALLARYIADHPNPSVDTAHIAEVFKDETK